MIKGTKINLRAIRTDDSKKYRSWINDRDLVHFNSTFSPVSDVNHDDWFKNITRAQGTAIFSIVEVKNEALIGSCSLRNIDHLHGNAELQIRIGEAQKRGAGLGTEAVELLLKHAFYDLNLKRVYLHVFAKNKRAIQAYLKSGMTIEGKLRCAYFINGTYVDVNVMSILSDEFPSQ